MDEYLSPEACYAFDMSQRAFAECCDAFTSGDTERGRKAKEAHAQWAHVYQRHAHDLTLH